MTDLDVTGYLVPQSVHFDSPLVTQTDKVAKALKRNAVKNEKDD